jgi:3-oxoacyl-[acyl-carrier protein] reductase
MPPASWCARLRNIIVSGGSRGIGLGIARRLAGGGDRVIALARRETAELAEAARAADAAGGALHFCPCDLSDIAALPGVVKALRGDFGPLYGLVNNAGLGSSGVLATMPDARIEELVRLNVVSPIVLTKYVVRAMMTGGAGRIVNIGSIVASTGYSGLSAYSATKAALAGFTRSLARELGPLGITVNAVAPGFVDTAMTQELNPGQRAQIARRSALQRMPEVADVADAVAFLLGAGAGNITGTVLTVDAGNTA